jgi:hypothetical protein
MAFIRKKKHGNRSYYYLVESRREKNKVRQINLKYFGVEEPSVNEVKEIINEIKRVK